VPLTSARIQHEAHQCGFEIAGVTSAVTHPDFARFENWVHSGKAAALHYLTDRRATLRAHPQSLLPDARSIICLGKLYNTDRPYSTDLSSSDLSSSEINPAHGWISRYAWGLDYHDVLRPALEELVLRLTTLNGAPFQSKICIDTAPLLERSYAHSAGLGWIGRNTCLINQQHGSWFFLAELLVDLPLAPDLPAPDLCGTCTRCIRACPTNAIVPNPSGGFDIDARLCISYLTIEERGPIPAALAPAQGHHIFGCDICQDVCPWNHRAHRQRTDLTTEIAFAPRLFAPHLDQLSQLAEDDFRRIFRRTPIWRTKYEGFLRNVAIAMGNSRRPSMRAPLLRLTRHPIPLVAETARTALAHLEETAPNR
jgi:epoxyqueuosine reductase